MPSVFHVTSHDMGQTYGKRRQTDEINEEQLLMPLIGYQHTNVQLLNFISRQSVLRIVWHFCIRISIDVQKASNIMCDMSTAGRGRPKIVANFSIGGLLVVECGCEWRTPRYLSRARGPNCNKSGCVPSFRFHIICVVIVSKRAT